MLSRTWGAWAKVVAIVTSAAAAASMGCQPSPTTTNDRALGSFDLSEPQTRISSEPISAIMAAATESPKLVELGARLFHDPLLSKDNSVACSDCHDLANGGDDGRSHSLGVDGQLGAVNAPTVLNAALNVAQFWDGRAPTLEDQIDGPLLSAREMGSDWPTVEARLRANVEYVDAFDQALGQRPSADGVKRAIAAFERTLVTPDAPFDRHLQGDERALNSTQLKGYRLFKAAGCVACHQGQNAGGNMYQRFGVFGDYFEDRGNVTDADAGRFNVTGKESDRHVFRVPSLRNVALTAPYFHDGSAQTLHDAVIVMAKYQLGKELSLEQVNQLVAFLQSLTGELPAVARAHLQKDPT